jgi:hypothetical protein
LLGERTWFFDTRGSVRRMGVSAHAGDSTMVFSLWQGDVCTGTFRLPATEAPGLISALAYGMTETLSGQPPPSPGPGQPEPFRKVVSRFIRQLLRRSPAATDTNLRLLK